ncbi:MAG: DegT/DnrJ/EryC1/StrS family aminotransferase [Alteromonadaceae bacterium]|nr:DegT/DnrJ/EryC1/StrS family aminotransferase [Alteromonadaceae bacterium]
MQFIDLQAQYQFCQKKIDGRIKQVLAHGQYIMGPEVHELEYKLADYVGVKHAISCANGTDALQIALMVLGIKQGDAVIVPTFTFFASAEAVAFVGATPVFVDSDPNTFNLSVAHLEDTIRHVQTHTNLNLKAIMAVDLFGQPADYVRINDIARQHGLLVIEDAAQGFGGTLKNHRSGSFGDIATTSFFPAKPLGCYGDGGAIFTNNDELAEMVRSLRVHGKGKNKYDNVRIGMNSRLDTIQAAILLEKLTLFPEELKRRQYIASQYNTLLNAHDGLQTPRCQAQFTSSWAQYTMQAMRRPREYYQQLLKEQDIPTAIYYSTCMHQQTAFKTDKALSMPCPISEQLAERCFSLPMHPYLTDDEIYKITSTLME